MSDSETALILAAPAPVRAPVLQRLALREKIEHSFERCAADLAQIVTGLRLHRAFFGGAWVVGLHSGGRRDLSRPFSRVDLQLRLPEDGALELEARITIRNRDLRAVRLDARAAESELPAVTKFIEDAFLTFTERYFDRS